MLIPGQVENWVSIVDFSKLAMASFPRKAMKPCMSVLQNNYRAQSFHIFSLNVTWGIRILYGIAAPFMEKNVKKKLTLYKGSMCKELISTFNPCQLEEKYGGKAPNLTSYW